MIFHTNTSEALRLDGDNSATFAGGITFSTGGHFIGNNSNTSDLMIESGGDDIDIVGSWLRMRQAANTGVESAWRSTGELTLGADAQTTYMLKVASGNSYFAGDVAMSNTGGWSPKLTITNTDNGSTPAQLQFWKRPADNDISDNDYLGQITFSGINSADQDTYYTILRAHVLDETDGSEDSGFYIDNYVNGTADVNALKIEGTTATFAGQILSTRGYIKSQYTINDDEIMRLGYPTLDNKYNDINWTHQSSTSEVGVKLRFYQRPNGGELQIHTGRSGNQTLTETVSFGEDHNTTFSGNVTLDSADNARLNLDRGASGDDSRVKYLHVGALKWGAGIAENSDNYKVQYYNLSLIHI